MQLHRSLLPDAGVVEVGHLPRRGSELNQGDHVDPPHIPDAAWIFRSDQMRLQDDFMTAYAWPRLDRDCPRSRAQPVLAFQPVQRALNIVTILRFTFLIVRALVPERMAMTLRRVGQKAAALPRQMLFDLLLPRIEECECVRAHRRISRGRCER